VSSLDGRPFSLGSLTVRGARIVAIDILADPERLAALDPALLP
jgi:RNA polymerase sigma-70 factor (ECF subfamily)